MNYDNGSVTAVLDAVTRCGEISRAELSELTGFSRVTVGKAVEQLCSIGMVKQYKKDRGSAGRKAEVCLLDTSRGMLIFDLSGQNTAVRICDTALRTVKEYVSESRELAEAFIGGFGEFVEIFGDGLLGIGCIVSDGSSGEYAAIIREALGHDPEVLLEASTAYAIADSCRFDYSGAAFFVRVFAQGEISGTVMYRDIPYLGAHGRAGRFAGVIGSVDEIPNKLAEAAMIVDPELIHIACEDESIADGLREKLVDAVSAFSGSDEPVADITVEPMSLCRTPLDGGAIFLRKQAVFSKLTNNS